MTSNKIYYFLVSEGFAEVNRRTLTLDKLTGIVKLFKDAFLFLNSQDLPQWQKLLHVSTSKDGHLFYITTRNGTKREFLTMDFHPQQIMYLLLEMERLAHHSQENYHKYWQRFILPILHT